MSKRGPPRLRRAIWLATTVASFNDSVLSAYYNKKRIEGKQHFIAIGAVAKKSSYIINFIHLWHNTILNF